MSFEATWLDGGSQIPQERPSANVEWEWSGGKSGEIGAEAWTEAGGVPEGYGAPGVELDAVGTGKALHYGAAVAALVLDAVGRGDAPSVAPTAAARTFVVPRESRTFVVALESRTFVVPRESRTFIAR